jgi:hypothetical protein
LAGCACSGANNAGKEEEGWHPANFYLSCPAEKSKTPTETVLAPVL